MGIMARKVEEPKIPKTPPVTRLEIEWWDIERVIPYERNARVIPQKAVEKVALSLRNFGWSQPIVVEPGGALFGGAVAYVWHSGIHAATVANSLLTNGMEIRSQIIWAKSSLQISRGAYHWQHEPCWYAVRKGEKANWTGDRKQSTLWQVQTMHRTQGNVDDGKTIHGTQKPVELMRRPLLNHTKRGDSVYDPFLGSGTTLIAAEELGRVCYGLELDPKYVDVIVQRWEKFTGRRAGLADDGRTFEQVAADRSMEAAA